MINIPTQPWSRSAPRTATLRLLSALVVATLATLVGLAAADPVRASCAAPPAIAPPSFDDVDVVLVGTVLATAEAGRWASVVVHEVWRGPDLPEELLVKGGDGGNMWTSIDRTYEVGVRYLFALTNGDGGALRDNACSATTEWTDDLTTLRPADARTPTGEASADVAGIDLGGIVPVILVVAVVAAVLLGAGLVARGREA
ncbi:MAG TPA: hypothetical protein VK831_01890 [Candidatus Deferrimicrobiaceae bacterium]|nr:hypothetical protein [Candidatus Deferrimicrobiaceae bacterium]